MQRAVFLDLEGPIVTHRSIIGTNIARKEVYEGERSFRWIEYADHAALKMVGALCYNFNAKLVITSMLRSSERVMHQLFCFYMENGFETTANGKLLDFDRTEQLSSRPKEIAKYVQDRGINKYVVFDDRDMVCNNFILINSREGITYQDYQSAKGFLYDESTDQPEAQMTEAIYI